MGIRDVKRLVIFGVASALAPVPVWASLGTSGGGEPRKPPQAAFDICKDKSEGAAVEIVTPRGDTIKATCKKFKDGTLVAAPDGPPPGPQK
ncbi:hypothetical protein [Geobacter sp. AOG2]|uniref:hypothetical protein n=1 Tax=Geobacter sp. AOG2 TaxID=1566347 RepID=UPI001CC7912D|nr:hypothetical protein [Geobacter sp. AOG2]GFE62771.1 hypothetical protein AOG2_33590 [Geobacter sp. AOG2]